jgi:hypothetical protein
MSRRAASFTQADVARALRAIKQVDPGPVGGVVRVRSDRPDAAPGEDEGVDQREEIDL